MFHISDMQTLWPVSVFCAFSDYLFSHFRLFLVENSLSSFYLDNVVIPCIFQNFECSYNLVPYCL